MSYSLFFRCNNGCKYAPLCYVIRTVPVLSLFRPLTFPSGQECAVPVHMWSWRVPQGKLIWNLHRGMIAQHHTFQSSAVDENVMLM